MRKESGFMDWKIQQCCQCSPESAIESAQSLSALTLFYELWEVQSSDSCELQGAFNSKKSAESAL